MALAENNYEHLEELGGSNYEIVDGEPNIIGWEVRNEQGTDIGEVDDLLFDAESRNVRYLIVDLDTNDLGLENKKILIPIGVAELDEEEDEVLLPRVSLEQLAAVPAYKKGEVNPELEVHIRDIFAGGVVAGVASQVVYNKDTFYKHDQFDEDKFYNRKKSPLSSGSPEDLSSEPAVKTPRLVDKMIDRPAVNQPLIEAPENGFTEFTEIIIVDDLGSSSDQAGLESDDHQEEGRKDVRTGDIPPTQV